MQETKGLGLYNVVIIGAGTAGLVTAAGTAGLGGRVALVERNKMGGDCLSSSRSPWEYVLFGIGLIATIVVTVLVTRIARRELAKSEVNRS